MLIPNQINPKVDEQTIKIINQVIKFLRDGTYDVKMKTAIVGDADPDTTKLQKGTIQFDGTHFLGWDGSSWLQLD